MMFDKQTRFEIYETIKKQGNFLGSYSGEQGIMSFLSLIWPLRGMESKDPRFKNAYDDAFQHLVNNNDWDEDQTYLKRFELIDGDETYFFKFVELVVHPNTRGDLAGIQRYVTAVNEVLQNSSNVLIIVDYYNGLPIYKFGEKGQDIRRSLTVNQNAIPFYKDNYKDLTFPCFVLVKDDWDDFGRTTTHFLNYKADASSIENIGTVKIMRLNVDSTWETLDERFYELSDQYCSLGQSKTYYLKLRSLFPDSYQGILLALRDTAFYSKIFESFERNETFRMSLIRQNEAEKIRRTIRRELLGTSQGFKFNFIFTPPYGDSDGGHTNLFFEFENDALFPQRIVALIGKNGVGKTMILSSMIENLRKRDSNVIVPKDLNFGKYFTVSYSVFDRFLPPTPDTAFNYIYCGLKKTETTIKSQNEQLEEFYQASELIVTRDLTYQWFLILSSFLSEEHLNKMFPNHSEETQFSMATFQLRNFKEIEGHFSSGESIVLFVMTKIVSEIREDSLILYDEPETHLHPNAISDLMNALSKLLDRFDSFCIMATHSPLIVRELNPSNVIVLKRNAQGLEANTLAVDSFGQNLTVITEEIFGNRDVNKLYLERIRSLVQSKKTFDEIIRTLQVGQIPVNLNTRLYISSLIDDRDEKSSTL